MSQDGLVCCSGTLSKKGVSSYSNWRKRYFELDLNNMHLTYYKRDKEKNRNSMMNFTFGSNEALGYLVIDPCSTVVECVHEYNVDNRTLKETEVVIDKYVPGGVALNMKRALNAYSKRTYAFSQALPKNVEQTTSLLTGTSNSDKGSNKLSTYKFNITCEQSYTTKDAIRHELRRYKFWAENEDDRNKWLIALDAIITRSRQAIERNKHTHLFNTTRAYDDFSRYMLIRVEPTQLIHCFNCIRQTVEDQDIMSLMIVNDYGIDDQPQSDMNSLPLCKAAINVELNNSLDYGTLFRRNSISTKLVTLFFKVHGIHYLQNVLSHDLIKLCLEDELIELDPSRVTATEDETLIKSNVKKMTTLCNNILKSIMNTWEQCPIELRYIMKYMREQSEVVFPNCGDICVGGLFFLRYICPAIVVPHLFGVVNEAPKANATRTLLLVTKVIQNIANGGGEANKKEAYMRVMGDFVSHRVETAKEFLRKLTDVNENLMLTKKQEFDNFLKVERDFISDDLRRGALQVLHQFFIEAHRNKLYSREPTISEQVDLVYHNIIDNLQITSNNQSSINSTSPPTTPTTTDVSSTFDFTDDADEEEPELLDQPVREIRRTPRHWTPSKNKSSFTNFKPATIIKRIRFTPYDPAKIRKNTSYVYLQQSCDASVDAILNAIQSNSNDLDKICKFQLIVLLYEMLTISMKSKSSCWDYCCRVGSSQPEINVFLNVTEQVTPVDKVSLLMCRALQKGCLYELMLGLIREYDYSSDYYNVEHDYWIDVYKQFNRKVLESLIKLNNKSIEIKESSLSKIYKD
ncbi:RasGAP [Acrasis kona]|uniref:RasGAP n=1 Tax=Acrasis kona TaxID=1008807 RepID=A0AAW2YMQ2_9EUKA